MAGALALHRPRQTRQNHGVACRELALDMLKTSGADMIALVLSISLPGST